MLTEVVICNKALLKIGAEPINSFTEGTKSAIGCSTLYETVRDEVLADYPWACAQARATLSQSAATPDSDYGYQYPLPASPYCLTVNEFCGASGAEVDYRIEGRMLLTDEQTCSIRFTKRLTDPSEFTPLLAEAIACKLASELADYLSGSESKAGKALQEYFAVLKRARQRDGRTSAQVGQGRSEKWTETER